MGRLLRRPGCVLTYCSGFSSENELCARRPPQTSAELAKPKRAQANSGASERSNVQDWRTSRNGLPTQRETA